MTMIRKIETGQPISAEFLNELVARLSTEILKAGKNIDIRRAGNAIVIGSRATAPGGTTGTGQCFWSDYTGA